MPKFDIKSEATRPFFATVGATDLTLEVAVQVATDLQGRVKSFEFEPKRIPAPTFDLKAFDVRSFDVRGLDVKALDVRGIRFDAADTQARFKEAQTRFEARINELQADALALPARAQKVLADVVAEANDAYAELVERGEKAFALIRKGEYKIVAPKQKPAKKAETQADVEAPATTSTAKKSPAAKKAAPAKATAKKATAKKATAKKAAPAKKATAKKTAPAKNSTAKKATPAKTATEKATAKKATPAKTATAQTKAAPEAKVAPETAQPTVAPENTTPEA